MFSFKTYIINNDVPFKNKLQYLHSLYLHSTRSLIYSCINIIVCIVKCNSYITWGKIFILTLCCSKLLLFIASSSSGTNSGWTYPDFLRSDGTARLGHLL